MKNKLCLLRFGDLVCGDTIKGVGLSYPFFVKEIGRCIFVNEKQFNITIGELGNKLLSSKKFVRCRMLLIERVKGDE